MTDWLVRLIAAGNQMAWRLDRLVHYGEDVEAWQAIVAERPPGVVQPIGVGTVHYVTRYEGERGSHRRNATTDKASDVED